MTSPRKNRSTGAGAEAAEGIHGQPKGRGETRDPADNSSLEDRETGDTGDQRGSEPLADSEQHRSSYGGDKGRPKPTKDGPDSGR